MCPTRFTVPVLFFLDLPLIKSPMRGTLLDCRRHNTPWCLMRELVTESTAVATAPVVYCPMFGQQSIDANWTTGERGIEGPVELMTGLKGCTSFSANLGNQCLHQTGEKQNCT